jgi:hypothetical protein
MMLESSEHQSAVFLTLTYNDENLPKEFHNEKTGEVYRDFSVNPDHHKRFIKNLQTDYKRKTGQSLSYYMCAEYGEKTQRPHYHYALFGYPDCLTPPKPNAPFKQCECKSCSYLHKLWGKGHIFLGKLEQHSAQYVAGYVTKKLTTINDYSRERLDGRHPEFGRMSRNPALGKTAVERFSRKIAPYIKDVCDIPSYLVHDGKKWPLGRYLRDVIKGELGFDEEEKTKSQIDRENHDKVLFMFKDKTLDDLQKKMINNGLPDSALTLLNAQRVLQIEKQEEHKRINKKGV